MTVPKETGNKYSNMTEEEITEEMFYRMKAMLIEGKANEYVEFMDLIKQK